MRTQAQSITEKFWANFFQYIKILAKIIDNWHRQQTLHNALIDHYF